MGIWIDNNDLWGKDLTQHFIDNSRSELQIIIERLRLNEIDYVVETTDGKIMKLDTDDKELIQYAKKNNPNLKKV